MGLMLVLAGLPWEVWAHCDTLGGPVVRDAEVALATGDVTPVLKWVRVDDEGEIREVFAQATSARVQGAAARTVADRLFFETLVRLHRAGEGAPFTGLQANGALEAGVAEADGAIEVRSADALVKELLDGIERGVRERFARVLETRRHAGDGVAQGREFVAAYVDFVHHVERLASAATHAHAAPDTTHVPHVH
jgi:hypothetical protein